MHFTAQAELPPLHADEDGALRVGSSRVLLELVIRAFQDGNTPETIVQRYQSLALQDVYAVIAYYLRHRGEVEQYLSHRETQAQELERRTTAGLSDMIDIRARLAARARGSG